MARKSKSSKDSQENKEAEAVDAPDGSEDTETVRDLGAESEMTDDVSDQVDTSAEADAEVKESDADDGVAETPATEAEAGDDSAQADSEPETSDTENEATEPEEPVATEVAGVVPAQGTETLVTAAPPPPPAPAPSAFPLVFGGIAAGAIGFLVATFAVPEGWPNPPEESPAVDAATMEQIEALTADVETLSSNVTSLGTDIAGVNEALAELSGRVDALPTQVAVETIEGEPVDLSPLIERLAALESNTAGLQDAITSVETNSADLATRLQELADAPTVVAPDGSGAMEAQLETFRRDLDAVTAAARAEIEEAQARANQIEADAAEAAATAARNAALAEVRAALESGAPFADALGRLDGVPDGLLAVAADGVVPMAELQNRFPDAARAALQGVQSVPAEASTTDRFASFLRRHTNARSLAPRDGDDPDAILSRAEAALSAGDIPGALEELGALPEDAAGPMAAWISDAEARSQAVSAMNEMN